MKRKIIVGFLTVLLILVISAGVLASEWPRDLGGRTIKIDMWKGTTTPLGSRNEYDWYDPGPKLQQHIEDVEEMFNCNIILESGQNVKKLEQFLNAFMAGDMDHDVIILNESLLPELAERDLIYPLDDVLDEEYYENVSDLVATPKEAREFRGQTYLFNFIPRFTVGTAAGIYWNKTLFEEEGLPSLYDIVEEGNWTFDRMIEIAEELTRDTDGDGEIDQYGMHKWNFDLLDNIVLNDASLVEEREGQMEVVIDEPKAMEVWDFIFGLEEKGVGAAKDYGTSNFADRKSGMYYQAALGCLNYGQIVKPQEQGDELGFVPPPKGPDTDEYILPARGGITGAAIPVTSEVDPRAAIEVAHALFQNKVPYVDSVEQWEENFWTKYSMDLPSPKVIEYLGEYASNMKSVGKYKALFSWKDMVQSIREEGKSYETAINEIVPEFQANVDDLFDQ